MPGQQGKHIPDQQVGGLGVANFVNVRLSRLYRRCRCGEPCSFKAPGQILGQIVCSGADKIDVLGLDDLSGTADAGLEGSLSLRGLAGMANHGRVGGGLRAMGRNGD